MKRRIYPVTRSAYVPVPTNDERRCASTRRATILTVLTMALIAAAPLDAQYFGRNKVQYETFDFKVLPTEHFDIHFYPEEETAVRDAARMAERWYTRLSGLFRHELRGRKPIVLYANQGDFQQTNTISGEIGEGTGGVTESFKDRVILPFTGSYHENDHVLGHELVHAFQYDIAGSSPGGAGLDAMSKLPLWFIEGMAEYVSVGREDPHTAMWLRDAVLRDDVPTLEDLSGNLRYFPYRYGQAVWAYIGGRWGDEKIADLYRSALQIGYQDAIQRVLGMSEEALSADWIAAVKSTYSPLMVMRTRPRDVGERVLADGDDGSAVNLSPSISPDGRYVAFLSSRNIFTIDLFLADARTGEVVKKLLSANANPHFDAVRFISSAGSWSPDGRKFAFVVFTGGNDEIAILDVESRDVERQIRVEGVGAITNPAWSPDGTRIAFSGNNGGISDLYLIEIETSRVHRLTNDRYADLQPAWSPDGSTIAFASDRGEGTNFADLSYAPLGISLLTVEGRGVRTLSLFEGVKHINPQYSPDGRDLYFISSHGGFNDIYRYTLAGGAITRVTDIATGVSGIGVTSPAMSVASRNGRMMFSIFQGGGYAIHAIDPAATSGQSVASGEAGAMPAGVLPPADVRETGLVSSYLRDAATGLPAPTTAAVADYTPSISLDYIGTPTLGVSFDGYGSQLGGGVSAFFSDMLGNHHVGGTLQMNGTFTDIGGQLFYLNQSSRWNWGVSAGHIPYLTADAVVRPGSVNIDGQNYAAEVLEQRLQRVFIDGGSVMASYPFSTTRRFETSVGYTHYGYSTEVVRQTVVGNQIVAEESFDPGSPPGLHFFQSSVAFVGDNSYFGFTSPVTGQRFRLEMEGTFGTLMLGTLLADFRQYFFANPVTLAFRAFHYGRYGRDAEDGRLSPLFLGQPSLVRGYEATSFDVSECAGGEGDCPEFDRLNGSRVGVANLEVRVPVLGTADLGLINFPYLPMELSAFLDAGVAWGNDDFPEFTFARTSSQRVPVASVGLSSRVNVFGYLIVEVYYAYPFQRPEKGAHFGFQIVPGW